MGEGVGYQECFLFCPYEKQFKMCNPSVPLNIQINGSYIENFSLVQYAQGNGKEEAGL